MSYKTDRLKLRVCDIVERVWFFSKKKLAFLFSKLVPNLNPNQSSRVVGKPWTPHQITHPAHTHRLCRRGRQTRREEERGRQPNYKRSTECQLEIRPRVQVSSLISQPTLSRHQLLPSTTKAPTEKWPPKEITIRKYDVKEKEGIGEKRKKNHRSRPPLRLGAFTDKTFYSFLSVVVFLAVFVSGTFVVPLYADK